MNHTNPSPWGLSPSDKMVKREFILRNFMLQPLFCDIKNLQSSFTHITFAHFFRENNMKSSSSPKTGSSCNKETGKSKNPSRHKLLLTFMNIGFNVLFVLLMSYQMFLLQRWFQNYSYQCFRVKTLCFSIFLYKCSEILLHLETWTNF
jgi:hypothetical protein